MLEQWIKENVTLEDDETVAVVNDDVWILPPRTFSNMTKLKKVILPADLRKIGSFAFSGCSGLEVVNIPPQVVIIDDGAFYGCRSLKAINLPNTVVGIGSMAFSGTDIGFLTIPESVRYIDDGLLQIVQESSRLLCPRIFTTDHMKNGV